MMKPTVFALLLVPALLAAELPHPEEQAALQQLAAHYQNPPEESTSRGARVIALSGPKLDPQHKGGFRLVLDKDSDRVVEVTGNRAALPDEAFRHFAAFPQLRKLVLHHQHNFDKALDPPPFDGSGIAALAPLEHLERVVLPGGAFSNAGLAAAAKLPQLEELSVFHTRIDDEGLAALAGHPSLRSLNIGQMGSDELTGASLVHLAKIPGLEELIFRETYATWDGGLKELVALKDTLKTLDLNQTVVPDADIAKLREALPDTEVRYDKEKLRKYLLETKTYSLRRLARWAPEEALTEALGEDWRQALEK